MKVVLLLLSGSPEEARARLREHHPNGQIEVLRRADLEKNSLVSRIKALRSHRPELLAISSERLVYQWGQTSLLLFGFLAGARRIVLLDLHGSMRDESRAKVLASLPYRLARETLISGLSMLRSRSRLRYLERMLERNADPALFARAQPSGKARTIAYLRAIPAPGTQTGGAATHLTGVVKALLDAGAHVSILSNDELAGLDQIDAPLRIIRPKPVGFTRAVFDLYNNLRFTREATEALQRDPPDFIYQRYTRFSWCGVEASLRTRSPLFLEYNGSEVWMAKHWNRRGMLGLLERCEWLNLRTAERVFVVSEVEGQNLLKAGVPRHKIVINPNGVDIGRFRPGIGGAVERKQLGILDDEIVFGFVGTFGPWHGVTVLAEAITLMPRPEPTRFLFVGDGPLRPDVERILSAAGVAQRAIFTGAVSHERVPTLLDACDVLASPHVPLAEGSKFFGSPTKLFEYMAMGKAIVASRLGQIADVLSHEESALLVSPGDTREMRDAMLRLANSPDLRARLGKTARSIAIDRYTWRHNADRVLDAYEEWLEAKEQTLER